MPNKPEAKNSKARSQEIFAAAQALIEEQSVDVSEGVEIRPLAKILESRVNCHYTTARLAIAKAVRRKRGKLVEEFANWGGSRPGAGYPKGEPRNKD